ncbi:MAG: flavin reductase family protein [Candidatus Hodarchaeota archaeon]
MKEKIPLNRAYRALYPRFTVLVTSGTLETPNVMTASWNTPLSANPPLVGVLIAEKRYSFELIRKMGEFGICVPPIELAQETLQVGSISGRDKNKFLNSHAFTIEQGTKIAAPMIKECPINLECKLEGIIPTGDHHLFIGRVLAGKSTSGCWDSWGPIVSSVKACYWRNSRELDVYTLHSSDSEKHKLINILIDGEFYVLANGF